ncbi:MAG: hypothetical protein US86_C0011G0001, partial [Candidatus Daviesbacteria bacterium GW2011_GWA2_38_24]
FTQNTHLLTSPGSEILLLIIYPGGLQSFLELV